MSLAASGGGDGGGADAFTAGFRAACPSCAAVFVLTEAHLNAREGLVRCGACRHIFNAKWHLASGGGDDHGGGWDGPAFGAHDAAQSPAQRNEPALGGEPADATVTAEAVADDAGDSANDTAATHPGRINMNGVDDYLNPRPNPLVSALWGLVALGFLLLLGGQVRYFLVDKYAQDETYRPYLAGFCEIAACQLPPRRDAARFTLTHTQIDLHPHTPGALRVTVKLVNEATFAQPYPDLELTLTDQDGWVVGRRTFAPRHYLPRQQPNQLASGELAAIRFDLARPHEKAVGFEVNIVGRPLS